MRTVALCSADPRKGEIGLKTAYHRLDRYDLLHDIGKGGMGTVYRGIDRQSGVPVAIKHRRAEIADSETVERFRREGRLNHPNIVQLIDSIESDGSPSCPAWRRSPSVRGRCPRIAAI